MEKENNEIVSERIFNHPQELVFSAWSDPAILANWWGPAGFTNTFHEFNFKPGGEWKFVMYGPDGADYPNKNVFAEIVTPELIVFDHLEPVHQFRVRATFHKIGNKTKLVFRMFFELTEEYNKIKNYVTEANEQNFDRLEIQLAKLSR